MTDTNTAEAHAILSRMPQAGVVNSVRRLGGLTNRVYHASTERGEFCLRIPGKGTAEYINRAHEAEAAWEVARTGVGAALLSFDHASGVMMTRYLGGTVTMTPELFKSRPGAPGRAGEVFKRLHSSNATFINRFDLFDMIDGYLKILAGKATELPAGYREVLNEAEAVRAALSAHALPLAACHCDPLCENFLDNGERMWLVDWEYSGMNDPMWDLADLSVEAGFTVEQDAEMVAAYFRADPAAHELGRIVIYKAMCDLLWTLWGLIQHANKNPADDFWAYSVNRFERCKALMATPGFSGHVAAVAGKKI